MRNLILCLALGAAVQPVAATEPVPIACQFEKLPMMLFIIRGGMGADDNTLQIGANPQVQVWVGSGLMTARFGEQELTFSLHMPASVTVSTAGQSDPQTYSGECISSPPRQ
jgi:hypothetical protein